MNDREMDYITSLEAFDQINDAFEELVDFFSRIYDLLYNEFYILEKEGVTNDEYFDYCMKRLKIYHKKIDRIVSRIGNINYKDFESYVELAAMEHNTMFGKKDIIVERICPMFNYSEDDEVYYDEDDEEYDKFKVKQDKEKVIFTGECKNSNFKDLIRYYFDLDTNY